MRPYNAKAWPISVNSHHERLSAAITEQRSADTRGVLQVIQRTDGVMLGERTAWWTYDIGEALEANEDTWCPQDARLVDVEVARSYIILFMEADLECLTA